MNPTTLATLFQALGVNEQIVDQQQPNTPVPPKASEPSILSEAMLARFSSRVATYDSDNRFFTEDFEELRDAKYLLLAVPRKFGGAGMTLAEVCREQRRLAYHAPATALALNMHLYWTGVAADLWKRGDTSLEWILREAAAGEVRMQMQQVIVTTSLETHRAVAIPDDMCAAILRNAPGLA